MNTVSEPEELQALSKLLQNELLKLCDKPYINQPTTVAILQVKAYIKHMIESEIDSTKPERMLIGLQKISTSQPLINLFNNQLIPAAFRDQFKADFEKIHSDFIKNVETLSVAPPPPTIQPSSTAALVPPQSWGTIGDYFTGNKEMEKKSSQKNQMLDRLGEAGQKALFEGAVEVGKESTAKREAFFQAYAKRLEKKKGEIDGNPKIKDIRNRIAAHKTSIAQLEELAKGAEGDRKLKLEKALDEKNSKLQEYQHELSVLLPPTNFEDIFPKTKNADGTEEDLLKLYHEALEEENNSREFRTAVFLAATTNYEGAEFPEPIDCTIGGASSTGKTYATKLLIAELCKKNLLSKLDEIENTLSDTDPNIVAQHALFNEAKANIQQSNSPKEMKAMIDNLTSNQIFKDDAKRRLLVLQTSMKKGNDVVAVDGGIEREMSQVRQIGLHGALYLGYPGIKDLHKQSKNLKLKGNVKKAALRAEGKPFNTATPDTFARPKTIGQLFVPPKIKAKKGRRAIVAFVEADRVQTNISGDNRAYKKENADPTLASDIKMNNFPTVESKAYKALYKVAGYVIDAFDRGNDNSKKVFDKAQESGIECYHLNNKIVHVRHEPDQQPPNDWVVADLKNPKYTIKLNEVDFRTWQALRKTHAITPNLQTWYEQSKANGTLQGLVITSQTIPKKADKIETLPPERPASAPARLQHTEQAAPTDVQRSQSRGSGFFNRLKTATGEVVNRPKADAAPIVNQELSTSVEKVSLTKTTANDIPPTQSRRMMTVGFNLANEALAEQRKRETASQENTNRSLPPSRPPPKAPGKF